MALNLSQKQEVVAELAEVASKAHSLVAAEYAGITVTQMTAMRKKARESGVYLKVVKNTLASRAVVGTEFEVVKDALTGPLLYAFSTEEPGAAGRLIKEFAKGNDKLKAKRRLGGRQVASRRARRGPGFAADPRAGACHARPRARRARQHVRPRRQGRGRQAGWWRSRPRRSPGLTANAPDLTVH